MRVVQIDPGPMPTLTPSAPALTRSSAPSRVTILPAITSRSPQRALILATISSTPRECPCEVSTTITSTPASRNAATRSTVSGVVPTAAPTRRRPVESLLARGNSVAFWKSLTVIMPRNSSSPPTTSTFSIRCLCNRRCTSSLGAPSRTVTSRAFGRHHRGYGRIQLAFEAQVPMRDNPTTRAPLTTGTPGDAARTRQLHDLADRGVRAIR